MPGVNQDRVRQRIGMVFQDFHTPGTALGNVMIGLSKGAQDEQKEAHDLAMLELERVGLVERADHYPAQLSGGQKQRVAIATDAGHGSAHHALRRTDFGARPRLTGEGVGESCNSSPPSKG